MTMIAFNTMSNRAEIITDSISYTRGVTNFGYTSKCLVLPHLDAAIVGQGSSAFNNYAQAAALQAASQTEDFDDLIASVPLWLNELRDDCAEDGHDVNEATILFVGYSPAKSRFIGSCHLSETGFAPEAVEQFVVPTPWTTQPPAYELDRVIGWMHNTELGDDVADAAAQVRAAWSARARFTAPSTRRGWVELAQLVREQRTLAEAYAQVLVGGRVTHTTLRRGSSETRTIHEFDDVADRDRLLSHTWHPHRQAAPCWCGSGKRTVDCHLVRTDPCVCRSSKTFGECCAIA